MMARNQASRNFEGVTPNPMNGLDSEEYSLSKGVAVYNTQPDETNNADIAFRIKRRTQTTQHSGDGVGLQAAGVDGSYPMPMI